MIRGDDDPLLIVKMFRTAEQETGLQVGDKAPMFSLPELRGGLLQLADVLDTRHAALVFYRGTWSQCCSRLLTALSAVYRVFLKNHIEIIAISNEHMKRCRVLLDKGISFPILTDTDSKVIRQYQLIAPRRGLFSWLRRRRDHAQPTVVLVDRDARVRWLYRSASRRQQLEPLQILRSAQQAMGTGAAAQMAS